MKPNDVYSYIANNSFSPDWSSLIRCYQPIIGLDALALYQYFWACDDNGTGQHTFGRVLNHLDMGLSRLTQALDVLGAMELLVLYQEEAAYLIQLKEPLSQSAFLKHPLYQRLLVKKIGEPAVEDLVVISPRSARRMGKSFSELFTVEGELAVSPVKPSAAFDLDAFKAMMARDRLFFKDETSDVIALYHLAEQQSWDWMQTYKVAKETAHNQVIHVKRMEQKVQVAPVTADFSQQEQAIIRESRSKTALEFLTILKQARKATVTQSERKCLQQFVELGLLDEVINVLVLYTLNKVDSANLNETYAIKIANDFSYKGIRSAEAAIQYLRDDRKQERQTKQVKAKQSNVPEWSKQAVKTEKTAQGQAELAALYRELEEMENKGEDR